MNDGRTLLSTSSTDPFRTPPLFGFWGGLCEGAGPELASRRPRGSGRRGQQVGGEQRGAMGGAALPVSRLRTISICVEVWYQTGRLRRQLDPGRARPCGRVCGTSRIGVPLPRMVTGVCGRPVPAGTGTLPYASRRYHPAGQALLPQVPLPRGTGTSPDRRPFNAGIGCAHQVPSTERAHWRPSRMAQTTSDWPRRMSPAANTCRRWCGSRRCWYVAARVAVHAKCSRAPWLLARQSLWPAGRGRSNPNSGVSSSRASHFGRWLRPEPFDAHADQLSTWPSLPTSALWPPTSRARSLRHARTMRSLSGQ